jgi:hypothetical protein
MNRSTTFRFRPGVEPLETREMPAFMAVVTSPGGGAVPNSADFDHDGLDDIVVVSGARQLSVSVTNGDGSFTRSAILKVTTGQLGSGGSAQDVNGDGRLDVVATAYSQSAKDKWTGYSTFAHNHTWLGRGDGTFGRATISTFAFDWQRWPPNPNTFNSHVIGADFNGDGIQDFASVDFGADVVHVGLRNADGTFQPIQTFPAGPNTGAIAVGDFNGDGWTDIIVVNNLYSSQPTLSVLLNDGNW